jgi:hypothetical protein
MSPEMSFMNSFTTTTPNKSTRKVYQDEKDSSSHYRNYVDGRFYQPLDQAQYSTGFAIGDKVCLRIRSLDGTFWYTNTVVRAITSYSTAKSLLGGYNATDSYTGKFEMVLVLDAV